MTRRRASRLGLACLGAIVILVATTLALTGSGHTVRVGPTRTVDVALSEYRLHPDSIRASSGFLDIHVRNFGRLTHNLVVAQDGQRFGSTPPIPPGQSADLLLSLTPGSYSMFSSMLADEALGAYGSLKVGG